MSALEEALTVRGPVSCYNGAFDSSTQAVLDRQAAALAAIREREPEAHVTYHAPHGSSAGGHVVHVWGRELSGYHPTRAGALADAHGKVAGA